MAPHSNFETDAGHLRLIGKISLLLAALSTFTVVLLSGIFGTLPEVDYSTRVGQLLLLKQKLDQLMVLGALVLVALTAVTTWVIALYSSFRVAGPMYRLARNLELLIRDREAMLLPLRRDDRLQSEAVRLRAAQLEIQRHYASLMAGAGWLRVLVESGAERQTTDAALRELRKLADHARL